MNKWMWPVCNNLTSRPRENSKGCDRMPVQAHFAIGGERGEDSTKKNGQGGLLGASRRLLTLADSPSFVTRARVANCHHWLRSLQPDKNRNSKESPPHPLGPCKVQTPIPPTICIPQKRPARAQAFHNEIVGVYSCALVLLLYVSWTYFYQDAPSCMSSSSCLWFFSFGFI